MRKRKILFISTNRADYNIQKKIISTLVRNNKNSVSLIITGTHLSKQFGFTKTNLSTHKIKKIIIKNLIKSDNRESILDCISAGIKKFKKIIKKSSPDLMVLIGDRYEIFSIAICCLFLKIKIAHIHGGEITAGSFDEQIRHSISKMSHLHFVVHQKYKERLIQMGEDKKKIFNYGSPSLDYIKHTKILNINTLSKKYNFDFSNKYFLVCYHAATNNAKNSIKDLKILLKSINKINDVKFIFTYPNPDPDYSRIIDELKKFTRKNKQKYTLIKNFGSINFFSAIYHSCGIIGNSSSGIIEVPIFRLPTINIGNRQEGREQSSSIINCDFNEKDIINKIKYVMTNKFLKSIKKDNAIFYKKNASEKIAKKIETEAFKKNSIKKFNDLNLKL